MGPPKVNLAPFDATMLTVFWASVALVNVDTSRDSKVPNSMDAALNISINHSDLLSRCPPCK
jgi:hypothetical protein